MILSTSELFWIGVVEGAISVQPLARPDDADFLERYAGSVEDAAPTTLYRMVVEYAELCGLATSVIDYDFSQESCGLSVADLCWGRNGQRLDPEDISVAITSLGCAADDERRALAQRRDCDECLKRFDELLEEHPPVAWGYAPKTPSILYGLKKTGRVAAVLCVKPFPKGIVRVLLRCLAPHMDVAPIACMGLAAADYQASDWHTNWTPSLSSLSVPLKDADRQAAARVVRDDLVGAAREEPAYLLGRSIGRADELLRQAAVWLAYELTGLDRKSMLTHILDFKPFQVGDLEQSDSSAEGASAEVLTDGWAADEEAVFGEWHAEVKEASKAAVAQVGLGHLELDPTHEGLLRCIADAQQELESAKARATMLGIETMIPALDEGISRSTALAREVTVGSAISLGALVSHRQKHRRNLLDYPEMLRTTVALAFGELRLRELIVDGSSQGLEPRSLEGWSRLVDNARFAVRDGLTLLKNGFEPYLVINAIQPTLEAVVRAVVTKHLTAFRGNDLGQMLFALHQHAKLEGNQDLEAFASIGLALRLPRNNAVHDPSRIFDKHDAAFFINGLAVMMRALG